jgi:hypothetical protein
VGYGLQASQLAVNRDFSECTDRREPNRSIGELHHRGTAAVRQKSAQPVFSEGNAERQTPI